MTTTGKLVVAKAFGAEKNLAAKYSMTGEVMRPNWAWMVDNWDDNWDAVWTDDYFDVALDKDQPKYRNAREALGLSTVKGPDDCGLRAKRRVVEPCCNCNYDYRICVPCRAEIPKTGNVDGSKDRTVKCPICREGPLSEKQIFTLLRYVAELDTCSMNDC